LGLTPEEILQLTNSLQPESVGEHDDANPASPVASVSSTMEIKEASTLWLNLGGEPDAKDKTGKEWNPQVDEGLASTPQSQKVTPQTQYRAGTNVEDDTRQNNPTQASQHPPTNGYYVQACRGSKVAFATTVSETTLAYHGGGSRQDTVEDAEAVQTERSREAAAQIVDAGSVPAAQLVPAAPVSSAPIVDSATVKQSGGTSNSDSSTSMPGVSMAGKHVGSAGGLIRVQSSASANFLESSGKRMKLYGSAWSSEVLPVIALFSETGTQYDILAHDMLDQEVSNIAMAHTSRSRILPVLDDGGFTIWETCTILRYVGAKEELQSWLPSDYVSRGICDNALEFWSSSFYDFAANKVLYPAVGLAPPLSPEMGARAQVSFQSDIWPATQHLLCKGGGHIMGGAAPNIADLLFFVYFELISAVMPEHFVSQHQGVRQYVTHVRRLLPTAQHFMKEALDFHLQRKAQLDRENSLQMPAAPTGKVAHEVAAKTATEPEPAAAGVRGANKAHDADAEHAVTPEAASVAVTREGAGANTAHGEEAAQVRLAVTTVHTAIPMTAAHEATPEPAVNLYRVESTGTQLALGELVKESERMPNSLSDVDRSTLLNTVVQSTSLVSIIFRNSILPAMSRDEAVSGLEVEASATSPEPANTEQDRDEKGEEDSLADIQDDVFDDDDDDDDWTTKQQIRFAVAAGEWGEALQLSDMMDSSNRNKEELASEEADENELHDLIQDALKAGDYDSVTSLSQRMKIVKSEGWLREQVMEALNTGDWAKASQLSMQLAHTSDAKNYDGQLNFDGHVPRSLNQTPVSHARTRHPSPPTFDRRRYHSAPRQRAPVSTTPAAGILGQIRNEELNAYSGNDILPNNSIRTWQQDAAEAGAATHTRDPPHIVTHDPPPHVSRTLAQQDTIGAATVVAPNTPANTTTNAPEEDGKRKEEQEKSRNQAAADNRAHAEDAQQQATAQQAVEAEEANRKKEEETRLKAKAEAEVAAKIAEEKATAREEATRKEDDEKARLQAEASARTLAEEEARIQAELLTAAQQAAEAEEAKRKMEKVTRMKVEAEAEVAEKIAKKEAAAREEASRKAQALADEDARIQAGKEAAAAKVAEEARVKMEEEMWQNTEAAAQRKVEAEEVKRKEEEEKAHNQADTEKRMQVEEEASIHAAQDAAAIKKAEDAKMNLEEETWQKAEGAAETVRDVLEPDLKETCIQPAQKDSDASSFTHRVDTHDCAETLLGVSLVTAEIDSQTDALTRDERKDSNTVHVALATNNACAALEQDQPAPVENTEIQESALAPSVIPAQSADVDAVADKAVVDSREPRPHLSIEVTLDMDFSKFDDAPTAFTDELICDLVRALACVNDKIKVTDIRAGSVIATVVLEEGLFADGSDHMGALDMLLQQVADKASLLQQGLHTKHVISIRLAGVDLAASVAIAHTPAIFAEATAALEAVLDHGAEIRVASTQEHAHKSELATVEAVVEAAHVAPEPVLHEQVLQEEASIEPVATSPSVPPASEPMDAASGGEGGGCDADDVDIVADVSKVGAGKNVDSSRREQEEPVAMKWHGLAPPLATLEYTAVAARVPPTGEDESDDGLMSGEVSGDMLNTNAFTLVTSLSMDNLDKANMTEAEQKATEFKKVKKGKSVGNKSMKKPDDDETVDGDETNTQNLWNRTQSEEAHQELDEVSASPACIGRTGSDPETKKRRNPRAAVVVIDEPDSEAEHSEPDVEDADDVDDVDDGDYTEDELARMKDLVLRWLRDCPHHSEFAQPTFVKLDRSPLKTNESGIKEFSVVDEMAIERMGAAKNKRWSLLRNAAMTTLKIKLTDKNVRDQPWIAQARNETVDFVFALQGHKGHAEEEEEDLVVMSDKYNPRSLLLFNLDSLFRRAMIAIVEWPVFDYFIMFVIFGNCMMMALEDPLMPNTHGISEIFSFIFVVIFCVEAAFKIIAYGFFLGPHAYLKDAWNCIDFFIVITGLLDLFDSVSGLDNRSGQSRALSSFRLLRPLRILRAIGRFSELRVLVALILSCATEMVNVLALVFVLVLTFGITGFQIWQGALRGRCYDISHGTLVLNSEDNICSTFSSSGLGSCPPDFQCLDLGENPSPGVVHFDNVGASIVSIFQVLTAQGWSDLMWNVEAGFSGVTNIIFIFLIFVGPLFLLKLIMVVIANRYSAVKLLKINELSLLSLFEVRVGILEAAELPRMDLFGESDAYVVMQLDNKTKKTRVIKNSLHPKWYEYNNFSVQKTTSMLVLKMFDWNRIGAHDFIGQIFLPVGNCDEQPMGSDRWYEMSEEDSGAACGMVRVQLQWRKNSKSPWSPLPQLNDSTLDHDDEDEKQSSIALFFQHMATSQMLSFIMILVIGLNVALMAIEHECSAYDYCFDFRYSTEILNVAFAIMFAIEMIIKILGLGLVNYCKDTGNMLYVLVVAVGISELPFILAELTCLDASRKLTNDPYSCQSNQFSIIRIFRLVRLFRIGRLIEFFPQLQQQLTVMARTGMAVGSLVLLMSFFVVTFAILGMNLFGGKSMLAVDSVDFDGGANFVRGGMVRFVLPAIRTNQTDALSTGQALLTPALTGKMIEADLSQDPYQFIVAQYGTGVRYLMTLEAGFDLSDAVLASKNISTPIIIGLVPRSNFDSFPNSVIATFQILTLANWNTVWYSCTTNGNIVPFLYFFGVIIIGNYVLFNLFAAIIIHGFAQQREELDMELREALARERDIELQPIPFMRTSSGGASGMFERNGSTNSLFRRTSSNALLPTTASNNSRNDSFCRTNSASSHGNGSAAVARGGRIASAIKAISCCAYCWARGQKVTPEDGGMTSVVPIEHLQRTRNVIKQRFGRRSSFVFFSVALADNLILIFFQGLLLTDDVVFETMIIRFSSSIALGLAALDFLFRCLFFEKFTDFWNKIDLFVMLVSAPEIVFLWTGQLVYVTPAFLFFRACRPLRLILRSENLRDFAKQINASAKPLANTFAIVFFCFVVLGILGVNQMAGKMNFCSDSLIYKKDSCVGISKQGVSRIWKSRALNYDWIGQGVVTMFVVASKDRWIELMFQAVDSVDTRYEGPSQGASPGYIILYFATVFVGGFFLLNIFAGVVVDTHKQYVNSKSKEKQVAAESKLRREDSEHDKIARSRFRVLVCTIVKRFEFDMMMLFLILIDVVCMCVMSYKAAYLQQQIATGANFFFSCAYSAEAMAKIYAFSGRAYVTNPWNRFEFVLVLLSVWGICLERGEGDIPLIQGDSFVRVLRIFRAVRVLRAFRLLNLQAIKSLQELLFSLADAAGHVFEVFSTLFVIYLVFGNLMVGIFGHMCHSSHQPDSDSFSSGLVPRCLLVEEADIIDGLAVSSVGRALVTLLSMNTADTWSRIMRYLALSPGIRTGTMSDVRILLMKYSRTGDMKDLQKVRGLLPGCQTAQELNELSDVLDCSSQWGNASNDCASTCGNMALSYLMCIVFFCLTSLVILNLLLAVLMQSLQEHQQKISDQELAAESGKSGGNVNLLMNVSKAATGWRQARINKQDDSDSDNDGPIFAGVSPLALSQEPKRHDSGPLTPSSDRDTPLTPEKDAAAPNRSNTVSEPPSDMSPVRSPSGTGPVDSITSSRGRIAALVGLGRDPSASPTRDPSQGEGSALTSPLDSGNRSVMRWTSWGAKPNSPVKMQSSIELPGSAVPDAPPAVPSAANPLSILSVPNAGAGESGVIRGNGGANGSGSEIMLVSAAGGPPGSSLQSEPPDGDTSRVTD